MHERKNSILHTILPLTLVGALTLAACTQPAKSTDTIPVAKCTDTPIHLEPFNPNYDFLVPTSPDVEHNKFTYRVSQPEPNTVEIDKYEYIHPAQTGKMVEKLGSMSLAGSGATTLSIDNEAAVVTLSLINLGGQTTPVPGVLVHSCAK